MYFEDDGIHPMDLTTAVFYDPCSSASTEPSEPAGDPGPKPDGELPATLPQIPPEPEDFYETMVNRPSFETPEALHTTTDFAFEVMISGAEPRLRMVTYY